VQLLLREKSEADVLLTADSLLAIPVKKHSSVDMYHVRFILYLTLLPILYLTLLPILYLTLLPILYLTLLPILYLTLLPILYLTLLPILYLTLLPILYLTLLPILYLNLLPTCRSSCFLSACCTPLKSSTSLPTYSRLPRSKRV
jgi:hypothetical protein